MREPVVADVPEESRYELRLDSQLVGRLDYRRRDGEILLVHTEVDPACRGRGYGERLVRAALEDARDDDLQVVPICPFVANFLKR